MLPLQRVTVIEPWKKGGPSGLEFPIPAITATFNPRLHDVGAVQADPGLKAPPTPVSNVDCEEDTGAFNLNPCLSELAPPLTQRA